MPLACLALALAFAVASVAPVNVQTAASSRPAAVIEGTLGWAGFADDALIHHGTIGAGGRVYLSRRVSVGPEVVYMTGPGRDRDLFVTGNLMFDVRGPTATQPRRVTPFVVVGGGWFRHSDLVGTGIYASTEGAFTAGAGVRGWVTDRAFVAIDGRIGWEPHLRLAALVGVVVGK